MQSQVYEYRTMIREYHLDTFGHVNNSKYLEILEDARWEFFTANGYGLNKVMETQVGPAIFSMEMQLLRELKNRENIVVKSVVKYTQGKFGTVEQSIYNQKNEMACTATFTLVVFDLKTRKSIEPTPDIMKALGLV